MSFSSRAQAAVTLAFCMVWATPGLAQTFSSPNCSTNSASGSADSSCYIVTTPPSTACGGASLEPASKNTACPAPYSGVYAVTGTRDMCTGIEAFPVSAPSNIPTCTKCPASISAAEDATMTRAILEVSELPNRIITGSVCSGFPGTCWDGGSINDPIHNAPLGRIFRDHVWIAPEAFTSGLLPTTNRIAYLLTQPGEVFANLPASPLLPKDPQGNPITNTASLYLLAMRWANSQPLNVACPNNGNNADSCDLTCSAPSVGWTGQFCALKTVQFWSCSDSYAVFDSGEPQPTTQVSVPYTNSPVGSSPGDYTQKLWDWGSVFGWNRLPNTGGTTYLCDATINTCNGWTSSSSVYKCRTPASWDCSYDTAGGAHVTQTCTTCATTGPHIATWDYQLTQSNDCPLTPLSTRSSSNRVIWQSDLGSCPVH